MYSLTDNIVSTSLSKKIAVIGFWQEAWGKGISNRVFSGPAL